MPDISRSSRKLIDTGKFGNKNEVPSARRGRRRARWRSARDSCRPPRCRRSTPTRRWAKRRPRTMRPRAYINGDLRTADHPNSQTADWWPIWPQGHDRCSPSTRRRSPTRCSFDQDAHDQVVAGLKRVVYGRGVTYPSTFYHATTGEDLFPGLLAACRSPARRGTAPGGAGGYRGTNIVGLVCGWLFRRHRSAHARTRLYALSGRKSGYGGQGRPAASYQEHPSTRLFRSDADGRSADSATTSTITSNELAAPQSTSRTRRGLSAGDEHGTDDGPWVLFGSASRTPGGGGGAPGQTSAPARVRPPAGTTTGV
jgi:hypothetical protein